MDSQFTYKTADVIREWLDSNSRTSPSGSLATRKFEEMVKYVYPTISHCVYAKDEASY